MSVRTTRADSRDVLGPTAGFAGVGLSAFVLLAAGPRVLGAADYSLLAVSWTVVTIVGLGLAFPGEQLVTRQVAAGRAGDTRAVQRRLLAVALALGLVVLASLSGHNPLLRDSLVWSVSLPLAAAAWALNAGPRGLLAGTGRFASYGAVLGVEAAVRILLCTAALAVPAAGAGLLASALFVPLLASAALGSRMTGRPPEAGARQAPQTDGGQAAFTIVALCIQVVLNTAVLAVQWGAPSTGQAGEYLTTATYLRIPMVVLSGFLPVTLSRSTAVLRGANRRAATMVTAQYTLLGSVLAATGVAVLAVLAPVLLTAFYGGSVALAAGLIPVLAITTVVMVSANLLTQVTLAGDEETRTAAVWAVAAVLAATAGVVTAGAAVPVSWAVAGVLLLALLALTVIAARRLARVGRTMA